MNRRKKLYVIKAVQGRILRYSLMYLLLYTLLIWHVMFVCGIPQHVVSESLTDMYRTFVVDNVWAVIFFGMVTPLFALAMLKLTNRVVGPLVPMERALRSMARGEQVEPLRLRKGDMLVEFADVFNELVAAHNRRTAYPTEREAFTDVDATLERATAAMDELVES